MNFVTSRSTSDWSPPAPPPRAKPLGPIALLRTLKNNPLEAWTQAHFEQPVVMGGLSIGRVAVISDLAAIRRVLLDNNANYRKDWMQRRILSAGLANGLLSAEEGQWKAQRRALAPLFSRKTVLAFSAAMVDSAQALVERLARQQDQVVDIAVEATRTTLDVLERTIFSDGFGRAAEEIRLAMKSYFDSIGRIDLFDLLGLPAAEPLAPASDAATVRGRDRHDHCHAPPANRRQQARRTARYFDAAVRSARSRNRRGAQRSRDSRERPHLHRRRVGNDGQLHHLVVVSAVAVARVAAADSSGSRPRVRRRQRRRGRPPARNARRGRGDQPALSA